MDQVGLAATAQKVALAVLVVGGGEQGAGFVFGAVGVGQNADGFIQSNDP
jgi:hypothetical protein